MGKMQFGVAHRILSEAQAAEKKLKEFNKLLEKKPSAIGGTSLHDYLESANRVNSDVVEEMTVHIERLQRVLDEAWWWHRQIAKSLLIGIAEEIREFQKIIVTHTHDKMNSEK